MAATPNNIQLTVLNPPQLGGTSQSNNVTSPPSANTTTITSAVNVTNPTTNPTTPQNLSLVSKLWRPLRNFLLSACALIVGWMTFDLATWTAAKDWKEYCNDFEKDHPLRPTSACAKADGQELPAPPWIGGWLSESKSNVTKRNILLITKVNVYDFPHLLLILVLLLTLLLRSVWQYRYLWLSWRSYDTAIGSSASQSTNRAPSDHPSWVASSVPRLEAVSSSYKSLGVVQLTRAGRTYSSKTVRDTSGIYTVESTWMPANSTCVNGSRGHKLEKEVTDSEGEEGNTTISSTKRIHTPFGPDKSLKESFEQAEVDIGNLGQDLPIADSVSPTSSGTLQGHDNYHKAKQMHVIVNESQSLEQTLDLDQNSGSKRNASENPSGPSDGVSGMSDSGAVTQDDFEVKRSSFFKVGRVFSILWPTPVGRDLQGHINNGDRNKSVDSAGNVFCVKEKLMLVVQNKQLYCVCCPISTYGGLGLCRTGYTRNGKVKEEEVKAHTIIYSEDEKPTRFMQEPVMDKDPIMVRMVPGHPSLHKASRVHFGRWHTVETNVAVKNVGILGTEDKRRALDYFLQQHGSS